ncbi:EscR/YscR/HrcR family type III secretion system export apparatus protein [Verrucomicrobia bacterium LW23]|nr:EscR/YscR/HrcR family type III secretion system export apparatus protein [Verrucomicrobia bacterium LW23]
MPDPTSLILILVSLSLLPFLAMMVTSFVKIVTVCSLIRNAMGIQQIPPNMVVNGLAIILSIYIMNPVLEDTLDILQKEDLSKLDVASMRAVADKAKVPLEKFLLKHTTARDRQFFIKTAEKLWGKERAERLKETDMMILVPAFTVAELTSAFQIGFLIYLPFIAIDLIVSNILLAMGMMMVSPMTISLPFKLLLFVLIDGWTRLLQGLILSYA